MRNQTKPVVHELPKTGMVRWRQIEPWMPVSRETLRRLSVEGKAPPRIRFGLRCSFWQAEEIHKWLADPMNYTAPPKPQSAPKA